jgi:hypothetical protein
VCVCTRVTLLYVGSFFQMECELSVKVRQVSNKPLIQLSALRRNASYRVLNAKRVFCPPEGFSIMQTLKDPSGFTPRIVLPFEYGRVFTDLDITNIKEQKILYTLRILGMVGASYIIDLS